MLAAFGDVDPRPVASFRAVFEHSPPGWLPRSASSIENWSTAPCTKPGLLLEHDLAIVGGVVVPVRLSLAALPGQSIDEIEQVYSHIQAAGQAEAFLRTRPWQLSTYNTAGAGKSIVERGERGAAAVLSPRAAALFELDILADEIQDIADNRTRFLAPCGARREPPGAAGRRPAARPRSLLPFATSPAPLSRARGVRAPRSEHRQARVAAKP